MRWDCPHCGVTLTISEDRAGAGWSFSRCSKCNGFALIRRAETHVIKVDRAPSGEKVLIPDTASNANASHAQNHLLSASAHRRLNEITRAPQRTTVRQMTAPPAPPMEARYSDLRVAPTEAPPIGLPPSIALPQTAPYSIEPPAAAPTSRSRTSFDFIKALPFAMGVFGTIAIGSGFYLFQQGQSLTGRMRTERSERNDRSDRRRESRPTVPASFSENAPTSNAAPIAANAPVTDQVRQTSMAPERPLASQIANPSPPAAAHSSSTPVIAPPQTGAFSPGSTNVARESTPEYEDADESEEDSLSDAAVVAPKDGPGIPEMRQALKQIDQNQNRRLQSRMPAARLISREDSAQTVSGLVIKPRAPHVGVYAQPTLNSKVIAVLSPKEKYLVTEWSDRWFKVLIPPPPGSKVGARTSAWVRNDLVQLLSRQP